MVQRFFGKSGLVAAVCLFLFCFQDGETRVSGACAGAQGADIIVVMYDAPATFD